MFMYTKVCVLNRMQKQSFALSELFHVEQMQTKGGKAPVQVRARLGVRVLKKKKGKDPYQMTKKGVELHLKAI